MIEIEGARASSKRLDSGPGGGIEYGPVVKMDIVIDVPEGEDPVAYGTKHIRDLELRHRHAMDSWKEELNAQIHELRHELDVSESVIERSFALVNGLLESDEKMEPEVERAIVAMRDFLAASAPRTPSWRKYTLDLLKLIENMREADGPLIERAYEIKKELAE